jgi:hypothetical protein
MANPASPRPGLLAAAATAALRAGAYDHGMIEPFYCGMVSNSASVDDRLDGSDSYYLFGARRSVVVGTLGADSNETERPAADPACP